MTRRGFTIVELIITITIMGILLTLAVVNVSSTQAKARDEERIADVTAISSAMETFFSVGNDTSTTLGRYPSTGITGSENSIRTNLRDVDMKSFMAPGITAPLTTFIKSTNTGTLQSIQTTAGVLPQPTKDQYVYQPIDFDGSICSSGASICRKFNIFYRLESDNLVYKVTSKNQ